MEGVSGEGCVCREIRKGRFWAEGCIALGAEAQEGMGPWERWDSAAQADQGKSEPPISRPAAQGGRDVWIATQPSDSEVTQGGHHPRAVSPADLLAVFILSQIPHPVGAILDGPRGPRAFARRRAQAGEAVEHFEFGFAAREVDALTGQSEELAHVGKIQMAVQSA